eukprot:1885144-Rhodomonas_salina.1
MCISASSPLSHSIPFLSPSLSFLTIITAFLTQLDGVVYQENEYEPLGWEAKAARSLVQTPPISYVHTLCPTPISNESIPLYPIQPFPSSYEHISLAPTNQLRKTGTKPWYSGR